MNLEMLASMTMAIKKNEMIVMMKPNGSEKIQQDLKWCIFKITYTFWIIKRFKNTICIK